MRITGHKTSALKLANVIFLNRTIVFTTHAMKTESKISQHQTSISTECVCCIVTFEFSTFDCDATSSNEILCVPVADYMLL